MNMFNDVERYIINRVKHLIETLIEAHNSLKKRSRFSRTKNSSMPQGLLARVQLIERDTREKESKKKKKSLRENGFRTKEGERRKTLAPFSLKSDGGSEREEILFFDYFLFFSETVPGVDQAECVVVTPGWSDRVRLCRSRARGRAIIESQLYLRAGNPIGTLGTNTDRLVSVSLSLSLEM